jgi:hypothetical protein
VKENKNKKDTLPLSCPCPVLEASLEAQGWSVQVNRVSRFSPADTSKNEK